LAVLAAVASAFAALRMAVYVEHSIVPPSTNPLTIACASFWPAALSDG
jgi:hypothetical protein